MNALVKGSLTSMIDPSAARTALRVALVVGSLRWVSACLTYLVPYAVNIHGQYVTRLRMGSRSPG